MARRFSAPYQSEPVSSLATWARNLAVFSLVAVLVSIVIVRFGFLEVKPALATFFGALACAGLPSWSGFAAFAAIWQNGSRGMGRILLAFLIDVVVLAYPAYLGLQYRKLPPIHDITTDPIDPPRFEALARLRTGDGANPRSMPGSIPPSSSGWPIPISRPSNSRSRRRGPMRSRSRWSTSANGAWSTSARRNRAATAASRRSRKRRSWDFARTSSIRIKPDGEGSRVDIRSSSRYFESDLGSNAARVAKLIEDINTRRDSAKPAVKKPQTPAKAPAKTVKKER